METALNFICGAVDRAAPELTALAGAIWSRPETGLKEVFASETTAALLEKHGFSVERGAFGLPTAIRAVWGSGAPRIGILGEYDALAGLAQNAVAYESPIEGSGCGHGCGHNLLCAASAGAALAAKDYLRETGLAGTVVFYGCPAEETLQGKRIMLENGAFRELDVALAHHPGALNQVVLGPFNAAGSVKYRFYGRSAHAAAQPHLGRSALDAAELMNVGANYLREHVTPDIRFHYTYEGPFPAPNIVPNNAALWYSVRGKTERNVLETMDRLWKTARGAAMMTETRAEEERLSLCRETSFNRKLAELLQECMLALPANEYTREEIAFAHRLNEGLGASTAARRELLRDKRAEICAEVCPISREADAGSTDVGDVSGVVPTAMVFTACYSLGTTAHSWQAAACAGMSIGQKGMLFGAKTLSLTCARLFSGGTENITGEG